MFARKFFYYNVSYVERNGSIKGVVLQLRRPFVNDHDLVNGRHTLDIDLDAPVVAVSYLGRMTTKQWNRPRD